MMHFVNLIKTIKQRRESFHITQEQLAVSAGVGLRTLKQIESGKGNPTLATIEKIADSLGMEVTLRVKNLFPNP